MIRVFQHEAGRTAFEGAKKQLTNIKRKIETKTSAIHDIQIELEKNKHEALEARKVEQVRLSNVNHLPSHLVLYHFFLTLPNVCNAKLYLLPPIFIIIRLCSLHGEMSKNYVKMGATSSFLNLIL